MGVKPCIEPTSCQASPTKSGYRIQYTCVVEIEVIVSRQLGTDIKAPAHICIDVVVVMVVMATVIIFHPAHRTVDHEIVLVQKGDA